MYEGATNENKRKDGTIWSIDSHDFQINNFYHEDAMTKLGLDYNDRWDALEYGFMLLKEQGTTPWKASKSCWLPLMEG